MTVDKEMNLRVVAPANDINFILNKIQSLADGQSFQNESILLTGGTGFFGKWMTQVLLAMNDAWNARNQLTILTRNKKATLENLPWLQSRPDVAFIEQDVRDFESNEHFTTIIHGAAAASQALNEGAPEIMFNTILEGTRRIVHAAEKAQCRRLMLLSSGAVYGNQPPDLHHVPESYDGAPRPMDPRSAYGEAKRAAEFLAGAAARRCGFQLQIARCFAFIGPYLPMDTHFAAGNFLNSAIKNEPITIAGDGTPLRSYLYAGDLMIWLITILLKGKSHQPYNVGSDEPVSIKELALKIDDAAQRAYPGRRNIINPIVVMKEAELNALASRYVPNVELAKAQLDLRVWTSLEDAAEKTLRWISE